MQTTPHPIGIPLPAAPAARWELAIHAESEPTLLARVVPRFTVPGVQLLHLHYALGGPRGKSWINVEFSATPPQAAVIAGLLEKLVSVAAVSLLPSSRVES